MDDSWYNHDFQLLRKLHSVEFEEHWHHVKAKEEFYLGKHCSQIPFDFLTATVEHM